MNISNVPAEGKCTGCRACEQVCSIHAITVDYDEFGFLVPTVSNSCTQCGRCSAVCQAQSMKPDLFHKIGHCYIAYAKDKKRALHSASGGAFIVIADEFIKKYKGTVYGCSMDKQFHVVHAGAADKDSLSCFQGSKYVQSDTQNSYQAAEKILQEGKHVLYAGTPCQIAGLKMFLKKEWNTLYTIDLICHGVPSQASFKKYINWLEGISQKRIQSFRFRNRNAFDASGYQIRVKYENGSEFKCPAMDDLYFRLFSKDLSLNSACYQCKFAQSERVGDITIGDSAAAGKLGLYRFEPKSSVMINTQKGKTLWDLVKNKFVCTEIDKTIETERNKPLSSTLTAFENRKAVCRLMAEGEFDMLQHEYPPDRNGHFNIHDVAARIPIVIKRPIYYTLASVRRLFSAR